MLANALAHKTEKTAIGLKRVILVNGSTRAIPHETRVDSVATSKNTTQTNETTRPEPTHNVKKGNSTSAENPQTAKKISKNRTETIALASAAQLFLFLHLLFTDSNTGDAVSIFIAT